MAVYCVHVHASLVTPEKLWVQPMEHEILHKKERPLEQPTRTNLKKFMSCGIVDSPGRALRSSKNFSDIYHKYFTFEQQQLQSPQARLLGELQLQHKILLDRVH